MSFSEPGTLKIGFESIREKYTQYYLPYIHDNPMIMSNETAAGLKKLGLVLYKAIHHLNKNYTEYKHLINRPEKEIRMLEAIAGYSNHTGTFRTDFIIDENNDIKIVEINAGQPFNGYFVSGVFNDIALNQAIKLGLNNLADHYSGFFNELERFIGKRKKIMVVHGCEKPAEILIYPEIFRRSGFQCKLVDIKEFEISMITSGNVFIILELMFDELLCLPHPWIERLMQSGPLNPVNSYFNAGDKRFFYLLHQREFIDDVLNSEEKDLLMKYLVPAWIPGSDTMIWDDAFRNKSGYILKHYGKGRGEEVYAGILTSQKEWEDLFQPGKIKYMVLQPFIEQKVFDGRVGDENRQDYVTGTLLFFNQHFFGPGLYRTHTCPVHTGNGDFRKMTSLVAASDKHYEGLYNL